MNAPITLRDLINATAAARARTQDDAISTRVQRGRVQVTRVTYPQGTARGRSVVAPLSDYLPAVDAIAFLNSL
jgi:hypothetical protein